MRQANTDYLFLPPPCRAEEKKPDRLLTLKNVLFQKPKNTPFFKLVLGRGPEARASCGTLYNTALHTGGGV